MKLSSILFYEKTNDNENMFLILSTTTTTTTKYESARIRKQNKIRKRKFKVSVFAKLFIAQKKILIKFCPLWLCFCTMRQFKPIGEKNPHYKNGQLMECKRLKSQSNSHSIFSN
ncbi:hypothetical protein DERP_002865 [Dermatophagoides pteronyssinus]|uniref:Uncharacterized protein n=1 Tax=Dermatophagoides pteronyssinus TaxID=6956 RepID=A0ABQ8JWB3_DERPT|nr:hypothetical protein DERP_002865 [Dermatophagoides pteronyssinus]